MENILKVFLMAFPEWLACIFMVVGLVVTALAAVRLGYGLVVAKTVYKWIVNAEEKFGAGAGAEKKATLSRSRVLRRVLNSKPISTSINFMGV